MMNPFAKIPLPTTEAEFNKLVDKLVKRYKLKHREHAAAVVCERIGHLPPTQAYSTVKYFGDCIKKNLAYQFSRNQSKKIEHELQVDQIVAALESDPNNLQAFDALEKAINDGSPYAKAQMEKLFPTPKLSVVSKSAEESGTSPVTSEPVQV